MKHEATPPYKILVAIVIFGLIGYALFNSRYMLAGPQLELEDLNPKTNIIKTSQKDYTIQGTSTHASFISINERAIMVNEDGYFKETFLLSEEINPIKIVVRDRFGKQITKDIKILYKKETEETFEEIFSKIRTHLEATTSSDTGDPALSTSSLSGF